MGDKCLPYQCAECGKSYDSKRFEQHGMEFCSLRCSKGQQAARVRVHQENKHKRGEVVRIENVGTGGGPGVC